MSEPLAQYTFLPWYRRGMSSSITGADPLSNAASPTGRPTINVKAYLKSNAASTLVEISKQVALTGPGDIEGINENAIIKVEPAPGVSNFEHNYLPYIEFYDEDFPWRYSPAKASGNYGNKLRPWLFLMVLKENEFTFTVNVEERPLPSIAVASTDFFNIPTDDAWAWAHVQVNKQLDADGNDLPALKEELSQLLDTDPDIAFSRLMSPRKLEKNTKYFVFLIPFFEAGVRSGLGKENPYKDDDDNYLPTTEPAWKSSDTEKEFPFYYQWEFSTSDAGDFEALATKLKPIDLSDLELPKVDVSDLKEKLDDPDDSVGNTSEELPIGAALMSPGSSLPVWGGSPGPDAELRVELKKLVNLNKIREAESGDPIVNIPPMYGQWHAAQNEVDDALIGVNWFHELNLDPRHRATAYLGGEVIRKHQEKLMDQAWEQVGEILEANKKLRQAQLAIEVSKKIAQKHMLNRSDEDVVSTTATLHRKIKTADNAASIARNIKGSKLTSAGANPGLKKVNRPAGKINKKFKKQLVNHSSIITAHSELLSNLKEPTNTEVSQAIPADFQIYEFSANSDVIGSDTNEELTTEEGELVEGITNYTNTAMSNEIADSTSAVNFFSSLKSTIKEAINPLRTIGERTMRKIPLTSIPAYPNSSLNSIKPVMAAPELPLSMYKFLEEISAEFIIPNIAQVENNIVSIMEPNQAFIEAYMAGLNHEMARELLWREYPTDQRGTYFKQFWNVRDFIDLDDEGVDLKDIRDMHTWGGSLGTHQAPNAKTPGLVLIIRGELLFKFPNAILYAQKAKFEIDQQTGETIRRLDRSAATEIKFPLFKARLGSDIVIVGYDLEIAEARGNLINDAGWFFIFQERAGEARFGLDFPETDTIPTLQNTWNELAWQHLNPDITQVKYVDATIGLPTTPFPAQIEDPGDPPNLINNPDQFVKWGMEGDAAQMAYILYQVPALLGIHASDLLPPPDPINPSSSTGTSAGNASTHVIL